MAAHDLTWGPPAAPRETRRLAREIGEVRALLTDAVMLRVTITAEGLLVEGRVVGPWVDELRRAADEALAREARAEGWLDLGAVSYVDQEGVALIRSLLSRGLRLRAVSCFVAELLGRKT